MKRHDVISKLLIGIWSMLAMTLASAEISFKPLTATTMTVPANGTATVKYLVTNKSRRPHTFSMERIPGVTQVTTSGNCSNPFVLNQHQSCILNLTINGRTLNDDVSGGPVVCQHKKECHCDEPKETDRLKVTKGPAVKYTVGGAVFGLLGTLVMNNNRADSLTLNADGPFTFSKALAPGKAYSVTIKSQPIPQTCTVSHGTGVITTANVTDIVVNCSVDTHTIGGTVSGLMGSEPVVLQNNGGDVLTISNNGPFTFSNPVAQGALYNITVLAQPSGQICTVMHNSGTIGTSNITDIQVTCAPKAHTVGGDISGLSDTVVLQNNHADNLSLNEDGPFTFATPVAEGAGYNVTVLTQPVGQHCTINHGNGTIDSANVTNVGVNCLTNTTNLTTSVSHLALSVTGLTEYGVPGKPSSGIARVIKITNTGPVVATDLNVVFSGLPSDTVATSDCSDTLASGDFCSITITPGSTATSNNNATPEPCSNGTAPTPGAVEVTSHNASPVVSNVVVLSYGCIYQGGYVYALNDTTPNTGSVGGKVVTTTDQAAPYPNGIIWTSNGNTGHGSGGSDLLDVSYDTLPGIGDASASSVASPSYSSFSNFFSQTYANPNPFTINSFKSCKGRSDGVCNTHNILAFYNQFTTNYNSLRAMPYTASAGPTNPVSYAAGLCSTTINDYSDWYLPAICEMGYDKFSPPTHSACGSVAAPLLQNMQSSLVDFNNLHLLSGYYWSSTEHSIIPDANAWNHYFTVNNGVRNQDYDNKNALFGVRCSRSLTL